MEATSTVISLTLAPEYRERALQGSWAMFEPEGDKAVGETFVALVEGGVVVRNVSGNLIEDFAQEVFEATRIVVEPQHGEVSDTAVRELILARAEKLLA